MANMTVSFQGDKIEYNVNLKHSILRSTASTDGTDAIVISRTPGADVVYAVNAPTLHVLVQPGDVLISVGGTAARDVMLDTDNEDETYVTFRRTSTNTAISSLLESPPEACYRHENGGRSGKGTADAAAGTAADLAVLASETGEGGDVRCGGQAEEEAGMALGTNPDQAIQGAASEGAASQPLSAKLQKQQK